MKGSGAAGSDLRLEFEGLDEYILLRVEKADSHLSRAVAQPTSFRLRGNCWEHRKYNEELLIAFS